MGPRAGLDRCGKSRLHRDSIPDRPARSHSLYRLSYRAHVDCVFKHLKNTFVMQAVLLTARMTQLRPEHNLSPWFKKSAVVSFECIV